MRWVDRKVAEMRDPFPAEFARDRVELEGYVRRARESIAKIPAIGAATLRGDGLISVVVPFHGRIGPLQRALASLKDQTYTNWEAIVVADSAFDPSDVIEWMGLSDRVRVARSRAMHGPAASRNLGIGGVNGEIVTYLDEDNRFDAGYLASVARAMTDPGACRLRSGPRALRSSLRTEACWLRASSDPKAIGVGLFSVGVQRRAVERGTLIAVRASRFDRRPVWP